MVCEEQIWVKYMLWWSKATNQVMLSFKGNLYACFLKRTNSDNQQEFLLYLKLEVHWWHTQKTTFLTEASGDTT